MKKKSARKILAIICMAIMLTSLLPQTVFAAEKIQTGLPAINIGVGATQATVTTVVLFGGKEWYVIGYNGRGVAFGSGTMTLLSEKLQGDSIFNSSGRSQYSGSNLQTAINDLLNNFDSREQNIMAARTLDSVMGSSPTGQYLWPLSMNEANQVSRSVLQANTAWWLRSSSGSDLSKAMMVDYEGSVGIFGVGVDNANGVRPAFTLHLSSVLFTSAAVGGKSTAAGPNLSEAQSTDGAIKFTLQDASQTLSLSTTTVRGWQGDTVSIGYSGSTTGAKQYISAIITDESGRITFYGKLKAVPNAADASGTVQVRLPLDYNSQTDTLKLFSEQINGDNKTDYTSAPVTVTVKSSYSITATAGKGGSISPAGITDVIPGGNQSFTLTPNSSYMVDQVFVDGAIIDNDNLTSGDGDIKTYAFSNLSANHTILAIFAYKDGDTNLGGAYTGLADNPKTGDSSDIIILVGLLGLSSLLAIVLLKRKNKKV